jgi:hypothetical protein
MILLDTSALRAISSDKLIAMEGKVILSISPITFYELLCHLDEGVNYDRQKGNIIKCRFANILHDPFAAQAMSVGADELVNPTRFEDPYMIKQLIDILMSTGSLQEFYGESVTFPDGNKSTCSDVAKNIRKILEDEENKYLQNLDIIRSEMTKKFPESRNMNISPEEMSNMLKSGINHLEKSYADKGIKDTDLLYNVACSLYIFFGYKIARTIKYIETGIADGSGFNPDRNDCEDAYIAIHLNLFRNDIFVTNDKGTIEAIKYTISSFIEMTRKRVEIGIRVIDVDDFSREFV